MNVLHHETRVVSCGLCALMAAMGECFIEASPEPFRESTQSPREVHASTEDDQIRQPPVADDNASTRPGYARAKGSRTASAAARTFGGATCLAPELRIVAQTHEELMSGKNAIDIQYILR